MSMRYMKPNNTRRTMKNPLPTRNLLTGRRRPEPVERGGRVGTEPSRLDRCPRSGGQIEQKPDGVLGQKYQAEYFVLRHEMPDVGPREPRTGGAGASLVEWARVTCKRCVA